MKKISTFLLLMTFSYFSFGQISSEVEMADGFRSSGKIYVVIATIAVVFIGLAIYLFSIDKRLTKMEKENK